MIVIPKKVMLLEQEKWLRKIPREGLNVSKYTVVCFKHFQERDIIKYDARC